MLIIVLHVFLREMQPVAFSPVAIVGMCMGDRPYIYIYIYIYICVCVCLCMCVK